MVNGRAQFPCRADQTIVEAGQAAGFGFPIACRNGVCLRCEGALIKGEVQQRQQRRHAGDNNGPVLYCVAQPLSDCEILVPEVTLPGELPTVDVQCQRVAIEPLTHDISRVLLQLPAGKTVRWHAGQYLLLNIDLDGGPFPFSIANACNGRRIELHIRHSDDNPAAQQIMTALHNAPTVAATLPAGQRHLHTVPEQPVWFICGSTGFAPVKAMIEFLAEQQCRQPVRLFWGARTSDDIYLPEQPAQWRDTLADFEHTLSLSESEQAGFHHGLVLDAALDALQQREPNQPMPLFYLGGSPPMAWAVFDALTAQGVPAEYIHCDVFDYAPR